MYYVLRVFVSFELILYGNRMDILRSSLANLEDEIFLKGGSVVTPQKFNLVLLIRILSERFNFYFLPFLLISELLLFPGFLIFPLIWNFWIILRGLNAFLKHLILVEYASGSIFIILLPSINSFKMAFPFFQELPLHCNLFNYFFKNSTKIWRWQ